jgi:sulfotransferase family protein
MLGQFKYAVKYALGLDRAGNHFAVFPDDTFLVSYPKSGNTWVRFLLANLMYPNETVGFANINRLLPAPGVSSRRFLRSLPRPRILKSHEPFDVRFRKVVYLVRDPRDVAVSEYHFDLKKRYINSSVSLEQFVKRFIAGETSSYGSWWEHAASWIAARHGNPAFLLVRYEDLLADSIGETGKIAEFLGIQTGPERLQAAVERSSADRMRKLEQQQSDKWTGTKNTRKEIPFVRAATSGGWKETLPGHSAEEIEVAWAPLLNFLGYELQSRQPDSTAMPAWVKTGQPL